MLDPAGAAGTVTTSQYLGSWALSSVEVAPGVELPLRTEAPLGLGDEVGVRIAGAHVFSRADGAALGHIESAVS